MNKKFIQQFVSIFSVWFSSIYAQPSSVISYVETDSIFSNPERGFLAGINISISSHYINSLKLQNVSIIQRIYTIPQFKDEPLSPSFLSILENDMNTAREGGIKVVPRFSYTDQIDGPDAALDTILLHISQIEPILQDNYDVIAYMDAGFIGAWGEWFYSSHGLGNTSDRRTVLYALLDAMPVERAIVVRTPNYKRLILEDDTPLSEEEAFTGTNKARTGAHNDCFLASSTDYGTYLLNDIEGDKNYLNQDNRYLPQGGETCNPSEFSACGNSLIDMERMHWSILNKDYHPDVLSGWETNGCIDEIKRRLGYRFSLLYASITDSVKPDGILSLDFNIKNVGFASPFNGRLLEIILRHSETKYTYRLVAAVDPRFWLSGDTVSVSITGGVPDDIPEGRYDVLLHLADPEPRLRHRAEYAIRLANDDVWEISTGYNSLLHQVEISNSAAGDNYSGENFFEFFVADSQPSAPQTVIVLDGGFDDWLSVPQLDVAPNEETIGDGTPEAADIVDIWVTNDENNLYISYKLTGAYNASYFNHVFFDTDGDPSTGFHSGGSYAGIDYMIENSNMYIYTGIDGSWDWTFVSSIGFIEGTVDPSRVEVAVDLSMLGSAGAVQSVDLVFNVSNLTGFGDDYAPDDYQDHSYSYSFLVAGIDTKKDILPSDIQLKVFPNPFNNQVSIEFKAGQMHIEKISIYDVLGRNVYEFKLGTKPQNQLLWNCTNQNGNAVGSGLYFLKVIAEKQTIYQKLILIK